MSAIRRRCGTTCRRSASNSSGANRTAGRYCLCSCTHWGVQVTLTGTGGVGKTQLALHVATNVIDSFPDGVWLAELGAVSDPNLVPQTVLSALRLREQPGEAASQTLINWIGQRRMLLVLDNCEHLIDVCAQLTDALLEECPNLRVLATSRHPLQVEHETIWRVPSLAAPDPGAVVSVDHVAQFAAAQLFVQRAQAIRSGFTLTSQNAAMVAAICARLDGLPLAIELAAAWVRALGVEQILERLDDAFELLVGGSRSAPSRQQTIRATLDWSHALLSDVERTLFRRLAVFVGGWSLEAAVDVCSDNVAERHELLARLTRLVDASLVQVEDWKERARYRLLEPTRQYAHMHLRASGELEADPPQTCQFLSVVRGRPGRRRKSWRTRPPGCPGRPRARAGQPAHRAPLVSRAGRRRNGNPSGQSPLDVLGGAWTQHRGTLLDGTARRTA